MGGVVLPAKQTFVGLESAGALASRGLDLGGTLHNLFRRNCPSANCCSWNLRYRPAWDSEERSPAGVPYIECNCVYDAACTSSHYVRRLHLDQYCLGLLVSLRNQGHRTIRDHSQQRLTERPDAVIVPPPQTNPRRHKVVLLKTVVKLRRWWVLTLEISGLRLEGTQGALVLAAGLAVLSAVNLGRVDGVIGAGLIIASLLLHELGHLAMAQALGVPVKAIGMCLKGAYLRRQRSPKARKELLIAASGPLANLLLYLWFRDGNLVIRWAALMNLVLAASNLIPIPGTDGARICESLQVLRSGLSTPASCEGGPQSRP